MSYSHGGALRFHAFRDMKVQVHRCFGGNSWLHLQERRVLPERSFPDNRGIGYVLNAGLLMLETFLLISTTNFHVDICIQCERLAVAYTLQYKLSNSTVEDHLSHEASGR